MSAGREDTRQGEGAEGAGAAPAAAALAARHKRTAIVLFSVAFGMLGMAYAAVPLYRLFCQVTGYAGTPLVAAKGSDTVLERTIDVRLDANVAPGLPWTFRPKQSLVTVRLGETAVVHYEATNTGTTATRGTAIYNVAPDSAGAYFNKIECFCFTEQTLEPGQTVDMPVTFFVDPALVDDRDTNRLPVITLSYTFTSMDKAPNRSAAGSVPSTNGSGGAGGPGGKG